MSSSQSSTNSRRSFLSTSAIAAGGLAAWPFSLQAADKPKHKVERLGVGCIGMRYQGSVITEKARLYGDIVAISDVDKNVREHDRAGFGSTP